MFQFLLNFLSTGSLVAKFSTLISDNAKYSFQKNHQKTTLKTLSANDLKKLNSCRKTLFKECLFLEFTKKICGKFCQDLFDFCFFVHEKMENLFADWKILFVLMESFLIEEESK
jgi:hypothetical protein